MIVSRTPLSDSAPERIGILMAGGTGSRLYPLTTAVNKQLLPIYDKPMIFYPLGTLMLAGVREIAIVSSPESLEQLQRCLGDGSQWGLRLHYLPQERPEGIAQGLLLAEPLLKGRPSVLILGDNLFYGSGLPAHLQAINRRTQGATIFGYPVQDPSRFGVVTLGPDGEPLQLVEKPAQPRSNLAVPGLYFYDGQACALARTLKPSARGELEITDLNKLYLERGLLQVAMMGRGWAWLDGGTPEALYDASQFVRVIEQRTGLKISCLEETAYNMGLISLEQLRDSLGRLPQGSTRDYLAALVAQETAF